MDVYTAHSEYEPQLWLLVRDRRPLVSSVRCPDKSLQSLGRDACTKEKSIFLVRSTFKHYEELGHQQVVGYVQIL